MVDLIVCGLQVCHVCQSVLLSSGLCFLNEKCVCSFACELNCYETRSQGVYEVLHNNAWIGSHIFLQSECGFMYAELEVNHLQRWKILSIYLVWMYLHRVLQTTNLIVNLSIIMPCVLISLTVTKFVVTTPH